MRHEKSILLGLLLLTFFVRLYGFSNPLADWHSWRQVDTSAVSRSFVTNGFDILHPKFHDISNVPSGKDNPEGYRFVEFPIYNLLQAGGYHLFNTFTLEQWGRVVTIIASTAATAFLFLIVRKHSDVLTASFAALFYAVIPFNIFFGRTVLPDPSMTMAVLGAIYFFDSWIEKKGNDGIVYYIFALIFAFLALLLKPYAIFFMVPMVYLAWQRFGIKFLVKWQLWFFAILTVTPLILWRWWMLQYPEGIPSNNWLFNEGNIRFKGAYFYWLFAERMSKLILGYWGIGLFLFGCIVNSNPHHLKKHGWFFYTFLLSSLLYMIVIARGNVQHDYYQILIVPSITMFLGIGARALVFPPKEYVQVWLSRGVLFICIAFSLSFGWYQVRDYYNINNRAILLAGEAVDRMTPNNAKIVAPYNGDTTLLYYTKRQGWPSFQHSLPELVEKGATHLLLINPTEKDLEIGNEYVIIAQTKEYLIFDLQQRP